MWPLAATMTLETSCFCKNEMVPVVDGWRGSSVIIVEALIERGSADYKASIVVTDP